MKGRILCLPCTVRTAHDIALKATGDYKLQRKIVFETMKWLTENPRFEKLTPALLHTKVQDITKKITGNADPFKKLKQTSNDIAEKVLPVLVEEYKKKPLDEGFKLAVLGTICGNTIDFEVEGHTFNIETLESSLLDCLREDLSIDNVPELKRALLKSRKLLYLLDNAGEIFFDRFLIKVITEHYPIRVVAAVKSEPILNDATIEDAERAELKAVAQVITTGNDNIGINLEESSSEFLDSLQQADLVIAKGQGNYESITEFEDAIPKPLFYFLRAKCVLVAESLGIPLHGNIVKMVT
jgi:uncharacterized protein with ATP-grasp and redox domains